jgi:peptidoglycan hydrolase CwlO-like protein
MERFEKNAVEEIRESLAQIKIYLKTEINNLNKELGNGESEIKVLKENAKNSQNLIDGNKQLIDKLLGELSKLQNDIDWYKRTYEQRTLLGTLREKLFKKKDAL